MRPILYCNRIKSFLSTSPLRGTTVRRICYGRVFDVFLSTSPLRGTTPGPAASDHTAPFLSTSPLRGTTTVYRLSVEIDKISIHVPLAGDDGKCDGKYGVFPRTFVTTRHSVQKHAALLCRMRPFSRRICTKRPKNVGAPRCEPPGVFLRAEGSHRLFLCGGRFCTGAFTPAKYRPAPIAARGRHARPWFCTGCPAGKSAGCPLPGR